MRLSLTINRVPENNNENLQHIYDDIATNIGLSSPPRVSLLCYSRMHQQLLRNSGTSPKRMISSSDTQDLLAPVQRHG